MSHITFYAPTIIDESWTYPDKRGRQKQTGKLSGFIFTRRFSRRGTRIRAERGLVPFSWAEDTMEAKAAAIAKAIHGMEELDGLDENPPLNWIPPIVKVRLGL